MKDVKWIKVSTDMFDGSRKIKQIEIMQKGDTLLVIWLKLLLLAGNVNDGGAIYVTPQIPYTEASLATELRRPVDMIHKALEVFCQFGMIEIDEQGVIRLPSWDAYQSVERMDRIKAQSRERSSKYRRKKREGDDEDEQDSVTDSVTESVTESVTQSVTRHAGVTHRHATEEEEEEGEREGEKEFHSLTLPREGEGEKSRVERTLMGGKLGQGLVMLSDAQMEDLLSRLSLEEFDKYVQIVAQCEREGKSFRRKTHYQAILEMASKDRGTICS